MADWQRDKLAVIIAEAEDKWFETWNESEGYFPDSAEFIADYLLAHGVSVVPGKVKEAEK